MSLSLNKVLEALAREFRQEKEVKDIPIGEEEVKLPLLADSMILHVGKPEDYTYTHVCVHALTQTLIELISLSKLHNKKSLHESQLFLCIAMKSPKNMFRKHF